MGPKMLWGRSRLRRSRTMKEDAAVEDVCVCRAQRALHTWAVAGEDAPGSLRTNPLASFSGVVLSRYPKSHSRSAAEPGLS